MSRDLSLASPSSLRDGLYKLWRKFTAAFSTTAGKTGQFWTDSKPIYRKVIAIAAGPNNSTVNTAHGISGLGSVISFRCMLDNGTTQIMAPNVSTAATNEQLVASVTDTNFVLTSGAAGNFSGFAGFVILDYTLA
jgi:hypothetical protein